MKMSNKSRITFVDTSAEVKKAMSDLAKSALRASAKVIRKHVRNDLPLRTKRIKNHVASWVFIDYKTGQPQMQVGFYGWQKVRKRGKQPSHASPWWIEQDTKSHEISSIKFRDWNTYKVGRAMLYDKSTGTSYGRKVQHPGKAGTHVLRNAVYNNIDEIKAAQEEYLKLLNDEISKATGKIYDGDEEEDD